jgi:hypothetical protein
VKRRPGWGPFTGAPHPDARFTRIDPPHHSLTLAGGGIREFTHDRIASFEAIRPLPKGEVKIFDAAITRSNFMMAFRLSRNKRARRDVAVDIGMIQRVELNP